jgi:hypothetical protein
MPSFPYNLGNTVIAKIRITEAGGDYLGDIEAEFPDPQYIHAEPGDVGIIEYIDSDHEPTVRFKKTGTATVVGPHEIELDTTIYSESYTMFEIAFKLINDNCVACPRLINKCDCARLRNYEVEYDLVESKLASSGLTIETLEVCNSRKYNATVHHESKSPQLSRKAIEDFFTNNRDYVQSVPKD